MEGFPNQRVRVLHAAQTDVGRQRKHNEDCVLIKAELGLFVVADGMGGHNAGDVASKLVASSIGNFFEATAHPGAGFDIADEYRKYPPGAQRLAAGVIKANRDVHTISNTHAQHHGMGSTCVAIHLSDGMVHVAHVGDSRCYRIRDGKIQQMTRDHSLINDALDMKPDLTKEELARLPKNIITRALGMKDNVKVDIKSEPVILGDQFLLCSDGLTGMVPVDDILKIITFTPEPAEACDLLVAEANNHGGTDNISALVVRVEEALPEVDSDAIIEAHGEVEESVDDSDVESLFDEEPIPPPPRIPPLPPPPIASIHAVHAAPAPPAPPPPPPFPPAAAMPMAPAPPMAVEELIPIGGPDDATPAPIPLLRPASAPPVAAAPVAAVPIAPPPPAPSRPISSPPFAAPPPPPPVPRLPDPAAAAKPPEPFAEPVRSEAVRAELARTQPMRRAPPPVRPAFYAQPEIEASFTAGSHVELHDGAAPPRPAPDNGAAARALKPSLPELEPPEVELAPISDPLPEPALEEILSAEAALALLEGGEIDLDLRGPWAGKIAVRRCRSCRHELYPGNTFCVECGARVEIAAP